MKRRRIVSILAVLLILFLGISAYFYRQHYITIKTCPVYEKVNFGDESIYITELCWENFERNDNRRSYRLGEHSFFNLVCSLNLPLKVAAPVLNTYYVYSKPYIKYDEMGYISIKGLRLKEGLNAEEELEEFNASEESDIFDKLHEFSKKYEIYHTHAERTHSSTSEGHSLETNILKFRKQEKNLIPLETKNIEISIKDNTTGISKIIQVHPIWESNNFSFFDRKPDDLDFAAEITADKFTKLVQENNEEKAEQLVLADLRATFPWQKLQHKYWNIGRTDDYMVYESNSSGFENVYSYNIEYKAGVSYDSEVKARQKIFLIYHQGTWKVIDVSPVID
ncbi:MAG: hypothetical protein U9N81_03750 [Bacillota bacterium]|nr:hypothetical protein [Bacillota bacterium]